ncbi:cysteine desulfurase family protein [Salinibacterium sp. ZJ77]|uniref:cysteine desulfurase family protein n=1 Tax=Salinibacterium sp. ZJ77 TaxID=2708337 RepID=UPI00141F3DBA|nr:cysteine desulfurase family protein [Salinibacterium sp. ZJ77]
MSAGLLYLDTAATTPVRREVLEAMLPFLTGGVQGIFGNPSSRHEVGRRAADALAEARAVVAEHLGCRASEVVFTSGGTEGANLAIKGIALGDPRGRHIVTSPLEHEAVHASIDYLVRRHGFSVTEVAVDADGRVDPEELSQAIRVDSSLVTIQHASNEIGTIQPIEALAAVARGAGVPFHTDAVQSAASLPVGLAALGTDAVSIAGHKIGAPRGIGAVALRAALPIEPLVHGGGQERGRRSGTENVAGAVGLATALQLAAAERKTAARIDARDALIDGVLALVPGALLTGSRRERLASHASFCFPGTAGEAVLLELESRGIACSSGSACSAEDDEPSRALLAIGLAPEIAQTAVRLTLPSEVDPDGARAIAREVGEAVRRVSRLG